MTEAPIYTGHLARDGEAWVGKLIDDHGWQFSLVGTIERRDGKQMLALKAYIVSTPRDKPTS